MNLQKANYEDLLSFYYVGTDAPFACKRLLRAIEKEESKWLKDVLRDHTIDGNEFGGDEEDYESLIFREKVDDLIVCYSIMEFAARGAIIVAPDTGKPFWRDAKRILENKFVHRYYRKYYPERLAAFLKLRLQGKYVVVCKDVPASKILAFLELDRQFIANHRTGYFLHLLDDYIYEEDISFEDLVDVIGRPQAFIKSCLRATRGAGIVDQAIQELGLFLQHCANLRSQMETVADWPEIRSAMALRYGAWFEILGDELEEKLGEALDQFLTWPPPAKAPGAVKEIKLFVNEAHTVLKELVSLPYWKDADREIRSLER